MKNNIAHQYQLYLNRVGLKEQEMLPNQQIETRRAFYGAWGQSLYYFTYDLPIDDTQLAEQKITEMVTEIEQFWLNGA